MSEKVTSDIRTSGNLFDVLACQQWRVQLNSSRSRRSFETAGQVVTASCQSLDSSSFGKESTSQQVHFSLRNTGKLDPLRCALASCLERYVS